MDVVQTNSDQPTPRDILRRNVPQWQGGGQPLDHFGTQLLGWLTSHPTGPEFTVTVSPTTDADLPVERGIRARGAVLAQTDAAMAILRREAPDRVVVLGGDCRVDLAPFAYLNDRYAGDLAVLWVDAYPDVMTAGHTPNTRAMVLRHRLGEGDPELAARAPRPPAPANVMYAGL